MNQDHWNETKEYKYDKLVYSSKYSRIFIGEDIDWKEAKGNSILIEKSKHNYVFIGECIYEFHTPDEIIEYHSPVGNSNVPYPYAIGEKNVYFMIEYQSVLRSSLTESDMKDPYSKLYGHSISRYWEWKHSRKRPKLKEEELNLIKMHDLWATLYIKDFKYKILVKRIW